MVSSDGTDTKQTSLVGQKQIETSESKLPAEYDLDKNPIKYATSDGALSTEAHDKHYMELTLRSGRHSELVQKLLRQRIELRAKEFPRWPGSQSSGVKAVWIESRFWYDRERLLPDFDDEWRMYRARYLHSLELDPREPIHVPEYEKEFLNPIRRFYMKGGDWLENKVIRKFTDDKYKSAFYRVSITRSIMIYFAMMAGYYWIRYNNRKWDYWGGPKIFVSAPIINPGHPKYPFEDFRTEPTHHWDCGFTRRNVYKDLRDYEDTTTVL